AVQARYAAALPPANGKQKSRQPRASLTGAGQNHFTLDVVAGPPIESGRLGNTAAMRPRASGASPQRSGRPAPGKALGRGASRAFEASDPMDAVYEAVANAVY
ncbi:MAG TPA: hypothetical protein VNM50_07510, partial [Chloroflexota bacterium]|nr:hypothetical protein [Chloroflexota bacterium]